MKRIILIILICLLLPMNVFAVTYAKVGADGNFNGDINIPSGFNYLINGTQISSDNLSDVASIAMLDEIEEVTGEWEFIDVITLLRAVDYSPAAADFYFLRARDGEPTADVSDGDALGFIIWRGVSSGTVPAAQIAAYVDGEVIINKVPGRLTFSTTPVGSVDPVLRIEIDSAGNTKMGDGAWTNYANVSASGVLTFNGTAYLNMSDKNVTGAGSISFTQELDNGSKTANFSVDFATDQKQKATLTANVITLTLDTTSVGVGNYLLKIVNGGLATFTWASESGSVYFPSGTDPALTASGTDIVTFYFDGTNWYGMAGLDFK